MSDKRKKIFPIETILPKCSFCGGVVLRGYCVDCNRSTSDVQTPALIDLIIATCPYCQSSMPAAGIEPSIFTRCPNPKCGQMVAQPIRPQPLDQVRAGGLIIERSSCHNAPIEYTTGGVRVPICSRCKGVHHEPRY